MAKLTSLSKSKLLFFFLAWYLSLVPLALAGADDPSCVSRLVVSAVVSDEDGRAKIECWMFDQPMHTYPTVGAALAVANTTNVTYVVLPPRSSEGVHRPPHPMLFVLLSGLAHVTLEEEDSPDELWVMEGVNGFLVAADVVGRGHITEYPSDRETVALQLPFAEGRVPSHEVLHGGACRVSRQVQTVCGRGRGEWVGSSELR